MAQSQQQRGDEAAKPRTVAHRGTEAEAIIETIERLGGSANIGDPAHLASLALAVLPEGKRIEDLKPYLDARLDAPRRIKAAATVTQVQSN